MNQRKDDVCPGSGVFDQAAVGERSTDGVHAKLLPKLLSLVSGAHQGSELKFVPLGMFQEMRKYASTDIT